ncbi:TenA family protein [Nakamurella flavida]|uniref:TenA family protein n=1 Tax=Nakamurella flavida TaxID=363630 RepID=A0A938YM17_9ACTN|nr:TenA family protein [Nakamurella flavida]MBM9477183.1 TenA family protein [Nakamurella flavida]MDP9780132.1 thiaminase/transcriptional activator TenA [Nakamurella flavida]
MTATARPGTAHPLAGSPAAGSPAAGSRFTDELWASTADVRERIDGMAFLAGLGAGTLPVEVFRFYLEQDSLYLAGYAKALALLAAKAPTPVQAAFWASSAHTAAVVETGLHGDLLGGGALGEPAGELEHSPTCLGYVSFLIATAATADYPVAAAAVLPCFWIYAEVAARLAVDAARVLDVAPDHPYARWVATYDGPEFQHSVVQARRLVDDAAATATDAQRTQMTAAFRTASVYEFLFWDTALHPQPWPV